MIESGAQTSQFFNREARRTGCKMGRSTYIFWNDTMCVPLKPVKTQTKAINAMRIEFRRANRVLALATDLMSTQARPLRDAGEVREDVYAKISTSN